MGAGMRAIAGASQNQKANDGSNGYGTYSRSCQVLCHSRSRSLDQDRKIKITTWKLLMDRSKWIAILTGFFSLLLGFGYLLIVQLLDFRGEMVPAPVDLTLFLSLLS